MWWHAGVCHHIGAGGNDGNGAGGRGLRPDTLGGKPPPQITLARYVVQWDVMKGTGYPEELANLQSWYARTIALHLTPDLALDNYNCSGCAAPRGTAEYAQELEALYRSFPDIKVVEAWNEPNNSHYTSHIAPDTAAHFMNSAYAFCAAHGCTAIAGDLLDSEPNMVEYEREYERALQPHDPANWGIHPYHAVKYMTDGTLTRFRDALPDPAIDRVWLTEVGAYYCEAGKTYGERPQTEQVRFLTDKLIPEFQPQHVFYYEITGKYDQLPACGSRQDDTALYAARSSDGPPVARAAASVIFGSEASPSTVAKAPPPSTQAPPAVPPPAATNFACEPALDQRWQHGECLYLGELFAA